MARDLRSWLAVLLFAALLLIQLAPVWAFRYFPSQDGRAHLYNSELLRVYYRPGSGHIREFFEINAKPLPNWFDHLAAAALLSFLPPLVAEKTLVSGYLVLFPLAAVYALRGFRAGTEFVAFAAVALSSNFFLYMGFYNFLYGVVAFLFLLGYWARHRDKFAWKQSFWLSVLSLICYFCHLFSFAMALGFVGVLTLCFGADEFLRTGAEEQSTPRKLLTIFRRRGAGPVLAFLPGTALTVWFIRSQPREDVGESLPWLTRLNPFNHLIFWLYAQRTLNLILAMAMFAVLAWIFYFLLLSKIFHRRFVPHDGFFLCLAACQIIYLFIPGEVSGGGFIHARLSLFLVLALLLWITASEELVRFRRLILVSSSIIVIASAVGQRGWRARVDDYLDEYNSAASVIPAESTMLSLYFSETGDAQNAGVPSLLFSPFLHAADLIALQKHAILLSDYEERAGYFPLLFRPELDPNELLASWEDVEPSPGQVEIVAYGEETGRPIECVLLWGERRQEAENADMQPLFSQLQTAYVRIFVSQPRGLLQVYMLKGSPHSSVTPARFRRMLALR